MPSAVFLIETPAQKPPCRPERREIMRQISRRVFLTETALAAGAAALPLPAATAAPAPNIQGPGSIGTISAAIRSPLFDGVSICQSTTNSCAIPAVREVNQALAAGIPSARASCQYRSTALMVNTGTKLVLTRLAFCGQMAKHRRQLLDNIRVGVSAESYRHHSDFISSIISTASRRKMAQSFPNARFGPWAEVGVPGWTIPNGTRWRRRETLFPQCPPYL